MLTTIVVKAIINVHTTRRDLEHTVGGAHQRKICLNTTDVVDVSRETIGAHGSVLGSTGPVAHDRLATPSASHTALNLVFLFESPSVVWPWSQRHSVFFKNVKDTLDSMLLVVFSTAGGTPQITGTQGSFSGENVPDAPHENAKKVLLDSS